ncbi:integral membrane protein [Fructilactobacillus florum DSM 22689 = JCM 16035]|uniref:Integral membrane protein n=1 Tax=Fructilactobacillus florum DSM 22689 = JCM 16035 TaxID=1423745 RepID=A0A0R2CLA3_9LACO|nr:integral membrane protein [Fructilactobacillus florum DSM 22689 = JCM 16035]
MWLLKRNAVKPLIIIQATLMFSFIQIIVPYSDVMVMPFVSLIIWGTAMMKQAQTNPTKLIGLLTFSLSSLAAYLMKPSAIILTIAILIGISLHFLQVKFTKKNVLAYGLSLLVFLLIFVCGIKSFNNFTYHNDVVKIKHDQGQPANHFIAMGITGNGAWSPEQVNTTNRMKTTKERSDYSNHIIKKQLKKQGIFGMIQFFIAKNYSNTSDGTFGWYRGDGPYTDVNKPTKNLIQDIYYQNGKYYKDYSFVAQIFWILLISLIIFGIGYLSEFSQMLRLSILGGLTFLLIFEGGRSRYLIQFLPIFLTLAVLSFDSAKIMIKNIASTIKLTLQKDH